MSWLMSVNRTSVFISVITLGEIRKGFELKAKRDPVGARPLLDWLAAIRAEHDERILPISDEIAVGVGPS